MLLAVEGVRFGLGIGRRLGLGVETAGSDGRVARLTTGGPPLGLRLGRAGDELEDS